MNSADFDKLVEQAYARIPTRFRKRMQNIAIIVEVSLQFVSYARRGFRTTVPCLACMKDALLFTGASRNHLRCRIA